jgi:GDP-D-mannose 3', 5'-epimerase
MNMERRITVTGAGGFIGGHLVRRLIANGHTVVRAVDIKPLNEWYQVLPGVENLSLDLRDKDSCYRASEDTGWVFNLACDMGGMGFIEEYKAACMLSVLINTHLLMAARDCGVERFFFASTACVYNAEKQSTPDVQGLRESDVYPAMPEDGYGWEKLFGERMCRHFTEDYGFETRIARYHSVYGPHGTWDGGREKVPAAVCRKVINAKLNGLDEIEIWGDGEQTRSFMYIDDCIEGTMRLMNSDITVPLNIGSDRLFTVNQLVDIVEAIAGVKLRRSYVLDAPQGVRGRNSDNGLIRELLGWAPGIPLEVGLQKTYHAIYEEIVNSRKRGATP